MKIATELRVEVLGGKVLGRGSTIDRYAYMGEGSFKGKGGKRSSEEIIKEIEKHTQKIIDQLPDELRFMTFAMDIALLEDGSFTMIESNPGGNSGFLALEDRSIKVLNDFLRSYPEKVRSGEIHEGLSGKSQIDYLKNKLIEWNITIEEIPDLSFSDDHLNDIEFTPVKLKHFKEIERTYLKKKLNTSCHELIKHFIKD